MENQKAEPSFFNFSDQIRLHTAGISSLSLGDSIWSDPFLSATSRRPEDRRNIESSDKKLAFSNSNFNRYTNNNDVKSFFSKTIARPAVNDSNSSIGGVKKGFCSDEVIGKSERNKKNNNNNSSSISNKNGFNNSGNSLDKRFKTLPASEALPRSQSVGGYIFVCNNETMDENLRRQLFGLPPRYRDSVRVITPGLPIFLYNYSTHQLHGIFEAASFGGTNIDPTAWEDKKHLGESRYPAQVRVLTRKNFEPLEEDSFRPILHHYDGPKFRLELSVPEALSLLDVFADNNA